MADSFFSLVKSFINLGYEEDDTDIVQDNQTTSVSKISDGTMSRRSSYAQRNDYYNNPMTGSQENKVVRMQSNHINKSQPMKLLVMEPKDFNECPKLVDSIKNSKPVIVNLEMLEKDNVRRIFDFLSGAVYALGGSMRKISNNIFVIAPENVDVLAEEAENTIMAKSASGSMWRR